VVAAAAEAAAATDPVLLNKELTHTG